MKFSDPIYLLLLVPALAWLVFVSRQMHGITRARRRIAVGVRAALLCALVFALAGLQTVRRNRGVTTIFVLDKSASMTGEATKRAEAFIKKSLEAQNDGDSSGLVVFGKDPVVDVSVGSLRTLGRIYAAPETNATDLAGAIRLASANFTEGTAKRLVLLTDGNETSGDAAQAASVAATDNIQIDTVRLMDAGNGRANGKGEAVVTDVDAPSEVTKAEPFELKVQAEATQAMSGVIRLDRDGVPVARYPVRLSKGANSFALSQSAGKPGFYKFRAVLEADGDADPRNNVGIGFVSVKGKPRVLLIGGTPGAIAPIAQALKVYDIDVVASGAEGLPTQPDELQEFDAVLFSDFAADNMTPRQMTMIASAVRESGVGFGMVGGENSFLPGGYYETPIAEVLPVDLNVRQRKVFPSTTILIMADCSGSMGMIEDGQQKIKIAASAAAATIRMMSPRDYVGVAGSTDNIEFVSPIQLATDKDKIARETGKLAVGGGGIYIRPSLEFAYRNLRKVNTRVRHLILLADGNDSDEQNGALQLARQMVGEKMTVSVVAIGGGKDVPFLKSLAVVGKGHYYFADSARKLQRMFTRDASVMSRSAIEEGTFLPKVDPGDDALKGINPRAIPALHAYDLTSDRPLSRVPMRTAKDDPLLAFWQYGLGQSMAFTSDAQPRWARPWIGWSDFNAFWAQTTRSVLRKASNNRLTVSTRRDGGKGAVTVDAYDPSGNPINGLPARVTVLAPDGTAQAVTIRQTAPGKYDGKFEANQTGGYVVSVAEGAGSAGGPRVTRAGFSIAYPPEYQAIAPNNALFPRSPKPRAARSLNRPWTRSANPFAPACRSAICGPRFCYSPPSCSRSMSPCGALRFRGHRWAQP